MDYSNVSTEELEQALAAKKKAEKAARERERKEYEQNRDADIKAITEDAMDISARMAIFKKDVHEVMAVNAEKLAKYGKMRSSSKGGFTLANSAGTMRIRRRRDTQPTWDERAEKGIALVKEFLSDQIKKRDKDAYEMMMTYITRNKAGDLEYSRVMLLFRHEGRFTDERWVEGLRLIKEGYAVFFKSYQYDFETLNEVTGKWEKLDLNFSAL